MGARGYDIENFNAVTSDVKEIYNLIEMYAKEGVVLPRSPLSLYFQYLQCLYVMKEGENCWSCWFTRIKKVFAEVQWLSSFAYICRKRDRAYASESCDGGSDENKCKKVIS